MQLGVSFYVFPTATHKRFEHCVGTAYLALKVVKKLKKKQPELEITDRDVKCVGIAGLCHDLGHGPYSHLFDGPFLKTILPDTEWTHEYASTMLLEAMVKENPHIDLSPQDVQFINDLIEGKSYEYIG